MALQCFFFHIHAYKIIVTEWYEEIQKTNQHIIDTSLKNFLFSVKNKKCFELMSNQTQRSIINKFIFTNYYQI